MEATLDAMAELGELGEEAWRSTHQPNALRSLWNTAISEELVDPLIKPAEAFSAILAEMQKSATIYQAYIEQCHAGQKADVDQADLGKIRERVAIWTAHAEKWIADTSTWQSISKAVAELKKIKLPEHAEILDLCEKLKQLYPFISLRTHFDQPLPLSALFKSAREEELNGDEAIALQNFAKALNRPTLKSARKKPIEVLELLQGLTGILGTFHLEGKRGPVLHCLEKRGCKVLSRPDPAHREWYKQLTNKRIEIPEEGPFTIGPRLVKLGKAPKNPIVTAHRLNKNGKPSPFVIIRAKLNPAGLDKALGLYTLGGQPVHFGPLRRYVVMEGHCRPFKDNDPRKLKLLQNFIWRCGKMGQLFKNLHPWDLVLDADEKLQVFGGVRQQYKEPDGWKLYNRVDALVWACCEDYTSYKTVMTESRFYKRKEGIIYRQRWLKFLDTNSDVDPEEELRYDNAFLQLKAQGWDALEGLVRDEEEWTPHFDKTLREVLDKHPTYGPCSLKAVEPIFIAALQKKAKSLAAQ